MRSVNAGRRNDNPLPRLPLHVPRCGCERKVGGKEEHFLLSRARAACYSIAVLQLSAFTRGPTRFFFLRSHAPILNYIIYYAVKEIPAYSRVPMLSSGSGLAEETVESIVGILELR